VARQEFGRALAIGGTSNHLHGLILLRPDISVSEAMQKWKSLSSGWVHKAFRGDSDFAWQAGYAAFSVSSSNKGKVAVYIAGQAEHHKKRTFEEEFLALLQRHGVRYDPAHVWD
jgi:REP element-mobilizing transposase RayT